MMIQEPFLSKMLILCSCNLCGLAEGDKCMGQQGVSKMEDGCFSGRDVRRKISKIQIKAHIYLWG